MAEFAQAFSAAMAMAASGNAADMNAFMMKAAPFVAARPPQLDVAAANTFAKSAQGPSLAPVAQAKRVSMAPTVATIPGALTGGRPMQQTLSMLSAPTSLTDPQLLQPLQATISKASLPPPLPAGVPLILSQPAANSTMLPSNGSAHGVSAVQTGPVGGALSNAALSAAAVFAASRGSAIGEVTNLVPRARKSTEEEMREAQVAEMKEAKAAQARSKEAAAADAAAFIAASAAVAAAANLNARAKPSAKEVPKHEVQGQVNGQSTFDERKSLQIQLEEQIRMVDEKISALRPILDGSAVCTGEVEGASKEKRHVVCVEHVPLHWDDAQLRRRFDFYGCLVGAKVQRRVREIGSVADGSSAWAVGMLAFTSQHVAQNVLRHESGGVDGRGSTKAAALQRMVGWREGIVHQYIAEFGVGLMKVKATGDPVHFEIPAGMRKDWPQDSRGATIEAKTEIGADGLTQASEVRLKGKVTAAVGRRRPLSRSPRRSYSYSYSPTPPPARRTEQRGKNGAASPARQRR